MRLVNLSNHPVSQWSPEQREAFRAVVHADTLEDAALHCPIEDWPFPVIDPTWDEGAVQALVTEYVDRLMAANRVLGLFLAGEASFVVALCVRLVHTRAFPILCATTERRVVEHADGRKESIFQFVRMRHLV